MSTKKTIHGTILAFGLLAWAIGVIGILRSQPVPTGLVARTNNAGQVIAGKLTSLGIWDATPYVKRDMVASSVNAAAVVGTDDSPNITRALADMIRSGFTTLYLPPGRYRINTPIALPTIAGVAQPALNFKIVGAGIYPGSAVTSNDPIANKVTVLWATNGNAIFDWDGAVNITFDSISLLGYTNLSSGNPSPPPYLVRFQCTGTGLPGLSLGGATTNILFRNCGFAQAMEGVRFGLAAQNGIDHCLFEHCQFYAVQYAYRQQSAQVLDSEMLFCDFTNVGECFFLEQGGHFTLKGGNIHACGYGVPSAPYYNTGYTFPTAGTYWLFDCGPGGTNAATVNVSDCKLETNSGQLVKSTGGHVINLENIDVTAGAWTGDTTNPWLFNLTGTNHLFWRGGYIANGANVHPGILSAGDLVMFDHVAVGAAFAASLLQGGGNANSVILDHVYAGTALQSSPI